MVQETAETVLHEIGYCLKEVTDKETENLLELILRTKRIFVAGVGRSGFACRGFAMRLMHVGLDAYFIGDTVTPAFSKDDLLFIGSGSGATASLTVYAEKVKKIGGKVAILTINMDSPIGRLADVGICLNSPSPKVDREVKAVSVQPMGSMFEQSLMVMCDIIVLQLMKRMKLDEEEMFRRHANLE